MRHYGQSAVQSLLRMGKVQHSINMVWIDVVTFSLILIRNAVGEDAVSKNFRFKIFPDAFLDISSPTTEAPDLLGTFTLNFILLKDLFKDVQ